VRKLCKGRGLLNSPNYHSVVLSDSATNGDYLKAKEALSVSGIDFVNLIPNMEKAALNSKGEFPKGYAFVRIEVSLSTKEKIQKCLSDAGFSGFEVT